MINGNINGIKNTILKRLEALFELRTDKDSLFSEELFLEMNEITRLIRKELCVVLNRQGRITGISIGNARSAEIPSLESATRKLNGYRVIHTHPSGSSILSEVDLAALTELRLDAIVAIGVNEASSNATVSVGFCTVRNECLEAEQFINLSTDDALQLRLFTRLAEIEASMYELDQKQDDTERAILVGTDSQESLLELIGLAEACNVTVVDTMFQRRSKVHSALYAGQGKIQELALLKQLKNANLVIFDDELSGSQIRNLEDTVKCKIIDRTSLILDIFARRARSREGCLQVELAMLNHKLPRLKDANANLARIKGGVGMKGGIGSRGPGEKKLETDRRHIERRIEEIRNELSKVSSQRTIQKSKRDISGIGRVAIVGYTNAGKSTLRNKLCEVYAANATNKEGVLEADMLFATLDTTVRAVNLKDHRKIALSDTVGFISKLPHELVEAFKSTLEEVVDADLLLHVVDASNVDAIKQIHSVNQVLEELNARDTNTIFVLNKVDAAEFTSLSALKTFLKDQNLVEVSALMNTNLDILLDRIGQEVPSLLIEKEFLIPYHEQKLISLLHANASILEEAYIENGTRIRAMVQDLVYRSCRSYEVTTQAP